MADRNKQPPSSSSVPSKANTPPEKKTASSVSAFQKRVITATFPNEIENTPDLCISFIAKQVDTQTDYKAAQETISENIEKSKKDNNGGTTTLAEILLQKSVTQANLILPLPNQFTEDVKHAWGQTTGVVSDIVDKGLSMLSDKFGKGLVDGILKGAQQTAANTGVRSTTTDPGFFQKYSGTEPRSFNFSWDFIIRSAEEADSVMKIFHNFKMYSAPSQLLTGSALLAPNYWLVNLGNAKLQDSIKFQPMVIGSVNINYSGGQFMDMYKDGTPKYMTLQIACTEISAITRQTYGAASPIMSVLS
jgi:hypothetical protein